MAWKLMHNHTTIAKLLHKYLYILWFQGINHDNILLFLSDIALYMIKTGKGIKFIYTKTEHISYLAPWIT